MKNDDSRFAAFGLVGNALFRLQHLEDMICSCWLNFSKETVVDGEVFLDFDSPQALYEEKRKKTLGVLIADIKRTQIFNSDFEARFDQYLKNRNRLVHRIFNESKFRQLNSVRSITALQRFVIRFNRETEYFAKVFDVYLGLHFWMEMETGGLQSGSGISQEKLKKSFLRLWSQKDSVEKRKELRRVSRRKSNQPL